MYEGPHGQVGAAYTTIFWIFMAIVFVGLIALIFRLR